MSVFEAQAVCGYGQKHDLHDALAGHGIGLLIDTLDIPERRSLVCLVIRAHHNRDDIELQPESRAKCGAHVLDSGGKTSADEL